MEHLTIKDLGNGFYKLTPEEGYMLRNKFNGNLYSEAVCKQEHTHNFEAVMYASQNEPLTKSKKKGK